MNFMYIYAVFIYAIQLNEESNVYLYEKIYI